MVFVVLVVVFVVAVLSATEAMRAVIARFMVVFMLVIANIMLLNSAPKIGRAEIAYINLICQQAYLGQFGEDKLLSLRHTRKPRISVSFHRNT
ncbi:hypothetical protein [Pseudovibrio sp. SCP19]|uniref:hypothetical protein n=1 Tax=Pseudovibrio sp. SCP19 TaxID=3141374 RepID=UPI003336110C